MTSPALDLGALRSAVASFEDALDVVGDAAWFGAQSPRVQNTLMAESDLPWRVDVVDWAATAESFREIIARDKVVLRSPTPATSPVAAP